MIVFVVHSGCIYEGGGVKAIYSTHEKALTFVKKFVAKENAEKEEQNKEYIEENKANGRDENFWTWQLYDHPELKDVDRYWEADSDYIAIFKYEVDKDVEV